MKKVIAAVLSLAMMTSSVAFAADSVNHGQLSAFENIKTNTVSIDELNQVTGENYILAGMMGLLGGTFLAVWGYCSITKRCI